MVLNEKKATLTGNRRFEEGLMKVLKEAESQSSLEQMRVSIAEQASNR